MDGGEERTLAASGDISSPWTGQPPSGRNKQITECSITRFLGTRGPREISYFGTRPFMPGEGGPPYSRPPPPIARAGPKRRKAAGVIIYAPAVSRMSEEARISKSGWGFLEADLMVAELLALTSSA